LYLVFGSLCFLVIFENIAMKHNKAHNKLTNKPLTAWITTALVCFICSFNVFSQVTAGFTTNLSAGCAPLSVTFTNTTTPSGGTTYTWNFGNGNTSTATSPGAIFSTPGTFTVTLTATNGGASNVATATITVYDDPIADFTVSTMPSCPGQPVTFTDNSTLGDGAIASWAWDFGDGTGQNTNSNSITHSYTSANTFPVSVIVTDVNGCSHNVIENIIIAPTPVASFSGSPISACAPPLAVNFTSTSTVTGTVSYLWNFGDGNTSTQQNPSNTYNALGGYNVSLTVTQGACSSTTTVNNYIGIQNITTNFTSDVTSACAGHVVTFTNQSFPLTANHLWDFGDGTTSTAASPTHTYANGGVYTITLVEGTGTCTDTETKTSYITIDPSPTAAFSANQTSSCSAPLGVIYSNTSTPGNLYTWDFGDGSPTLTIGSTANFLYTYTTPGSYTVSLVVTSGANGCTATETKNDYITVADVTTDFTASPFQGCVPLPVTFTSTSVSDFDPIVSYEWNYGNGTATTAIPTASNTYAALGDYTVKLVVETASGCRDSITKVNYIKTGTKPTANFSVVDPTVCYGTEAEFIDLSVGADSAYWEFDVSQGTFSTPFGAPMPYNPVTNLFPDTGTFYVRQIVFNNGCADTLQLDDIIRILPPKPIFSYVVDCEDTYNVTFNDESLGADSITWDFGDGSPLVIQDTMPTHTFPARGNQTITLTAYNYTTGCFSSAPQIITIAEPIAQFSVSPPQGCYPLAVILTSTSQDESSVVWQYGDGTPDDATPSPVTHVYFNPGLDTATLIITDINGCTDTATSLVNVYGPTPDLTANVTAGCTPLTVVFSDNSVSDSALVEWTWDFGDGSPVETITTSTVNHIYMASGSYDVTMTVTDVNGCTKSITYNNYIQPTYPIPAFVADTFACKNEVVIFDASGTMAAAPATYSWNFGDGQTTTGIVATHLYTIDNLYTVTLTVTDVNGCDSSIQHQILIQHPTAAFSDSVLLIGCGFTNMQFTEHCTGDSLSAWQWDFGDVASATQQNPMHAYTLPATYTVSLVVTNAAGCSDTVANNVDVPGPSGTFSFAPIAGCPPLTPTFTAVSSTAVSYTWDFGDGTVITTANPVTQYTYNTDIVATPALLLNFILSDGSTCQLPAPTAGLVTVVTVVPTVLTSADATSGCYPLTVNFTDLSSLPGTIPGDTISTWLWDFGDGTTSSEQNPSHTYSQAGSYNVSLSVTSAGGCSNINSTTPLVITVHPYPIAAFSVNATSFELPYDILSTTNQTAGAVSYFWNFGDGTSSTLFEPQHLYTSVNTFQIQLIAVNQFGCPDTTYSTVITNADVVYPNAFSPSLDGSPGGAYTQFTTNNDIFFPYTSGVIEYKLSIYNRWGELVFDTDDVFIGWDGYYKGRLCEQGVYVWKAYLKFNNGKEVTQSGDVTLLH
jgi:PKD repeat protein